MKGITQITKKLLPGQDLRKEIERLVRKRKVSAGCVLSMVGNLDRAMLRMAGGKVVKSWKQIFEIVSATGTVSTGGCHIHIAISDKSGRVVGGHLKEGCIVRTTTEVVILVFEGTKYKRIFDRKTGYDELVIE